MTPTEVEVSLVTKVQLRARASLQPQCVFKKSGFLPTGLTSAYTNPVRRIICGEVVGDTWNE